MSYGHHVPREIDHNGTRVINAFERYTIEIPDREVKVREWNQVIYKTRHKAEDDDYAMVLK